MQKILRGLMYAYVCLFVSCDQDSDSLPLSFNFQTPRYGDAAFTTEPDTIYFPLKDSSMRNPGFYNYFVQNGQEYIAVGDEVSGSLNIYSFTSKTCIKKIKLKDRLSSYHPKLTSIYCKNLDSIFVSIINKNLYLLDGDGNLQKRITFPKQEYSDVSAFHNSRPPFVKESSLYFGVRPSQGITYKNGLMSQKLIYGFNLSKGEKSLSYIMPEKYHKNFYDYHFLNYSYCVNGKGNIVFSFPADSNIYETDLLHFNNAYNSRSRNQIEDILGETEDDLKGKNPYKQSFLRDIYGQIYYDPKNRCYFRLFSKRLTEEEFASGKRDREQSVIIFNYKFQIVGECVLPQSLYFKTFFWNKDGQIFAQAKSKNKAALLFVKVNFEGTFQ